MQEAAATIEKIVEQKIQMHLQNIELEYQGKFEEAIRAVLPEPEDPEKLKERQRQERLDNIIIQHRARTELRKQAENEWNTQPEETRIKKVGWFKKRGRSCKKTTFHRKLY